MIKIGIDCRPLTKKPTGVAKYLADAIRALHDFAPKIEMYLFAPKELDKNTINLNGERIHVVVCPLTVLNKYLLQMGKGHIILCILLPFSKIVLSSNSLGANKYKSISGTY